MDPLKERMSASWKPKQGLIRDSVDLQRFTWLSTLVRSRVGCRVLFWGLELWSGVELATRWLFFVVLQIKPYTPKVLSQNLESRSPSPTGSFGFSRPFAG